MGRTGDRLLGMAGMLLTTAVLAAPPAPATNPPAAKPSAAPIDQAWQLILQARQAYQGVRDYTATFIKRERINGELLPENVMLMHCRSQPFSVYFRWAAPKANVGQEACYVAGKNNGKMRVKPVGFAGIVGWVSIDPQDPRAMKTNRNPITKAGIGNLIEKIAASWEHARQTGKTQVAIAQYSYNNRPCTRVETITPDRSAGSYAYRCVIYFEHENRLPIRFEAYDWPRPGGDPQGDLLECYSYVNLRLNVGLSDEVFNR